MRKINLLRILSLLLFQIPLNAASLAPYTPAYSTSTVQGTNIITNYYDPYATTAPGPGLVPSPLDSRLNGPLQSWSQPSAPAYTPAINPSAYTAGYLGNASAYATGAYAVPQPAAAPIPNATYAAQPPAFDINGQPIPPATGFAPTFVPSTVPGTTYRPNAPLNPIFGENGFPGGVPALPTYFYPGLVRYSAVHQWVGSDYLYELPQNISVIVEIVVPPEFPFQIDTDAIRGNIESLFSASGIIPTSLSIGDLAPLPFFHLIIYALPLKDSFVFSMSGRLFEQVKLDRLDYRLPGTWQAITWEKQELVMTPQSQFAVQLNETAKNIVDAFTDRVLYFRHQKSEQDDVLRLNCGPGAVPYPPQREGNLNKYGIINGNGSGSEVNVVGGRGSAAGTGAPNGRCNCHR